MKFGLDVHGVVDTHPEAFRIFAEKMIKEGHEIHIVTGQEEKNVEPLVKKLEVPYTHFYSIVDYHLATGTSMWLDKGTWWMDTVTWQSSKGLYCKYRGLDVLIDNSIEYKFYMPDTCKFLFVEADTDIDLLLKSINT